MRISEKLQETIKNNKISISFEYFPPRTNTGVQNLYDRIERMSTFGPLFIDITWKRSTQAKEHNPTLKLVASTQSVYGLDTCMHLICVGMARETVDNALKTAYDAGCQNILALRGDLPPELTPEDLKSSHFTSVIELISYIRENYPTFDIAVAGYPEGHPDDKDEEAAMRHLKAKIDAGGTFVITQMVYDFEKFSAWIKRCREYDIDVPIVPGIMPITSYSALLRRAAACNVQIPQHWLAELEPLKNDDMAVREHGTQLLVELIQKIFNIGIYQLHFYTMNLESATAMILERLEYIPDPCLVNPLPWRKCLARNRESENVRPIFWKNRHESYVARTAGWDEFPNGRWGDSRSPAFGEVDSYGEGLKINLEAALEQWGIPHNMEDLCNVFVKYCRKEIKKLPWSDSPITAEVDSIIPSLIELNQNGFLTINSQVAVDGTRSSDPVFGWGPRPGYIYQKPYLEFFVHPKYLELLVELIKRNEEVTFHAVNDVGDFHTNTQNTGPNALTWGVFPGKEIIQPTIVESVSFLAWKDEAYRLGRDWANCYDIDSQSRKLINNVMNSYYLVNIVHKFVANRSCDSTNNVQ